MEANLYEVEWCQSRYDQLSLVEEKRMTVLYQKRMKKAFDKKVRPRVFREGDLVLKKILSSTLIIWESGLLIMKAHMLLRCNDSYNYGW